MLHNILVSDPAPILLCFRRAQRPSVLCGLWRQGYGDGNKSLHSPGNWCWGGDSFQDTVGLCGDSLPQRIQEGSRRRLGRTSETRLEVTGTQMHKKVIQYEWLWHGINKLMIGSSLCRHTSLQQCLMYIWMDMHHFVYQYRFTKQENHTYNSMTLPRNLSTVISKTCQACSGHLVWEQLPNSELGFF